VLTLVGCVVAAIAFVTMQDMQAASIGKGMDQF
jgi:hypothetical protein